MGRRQIALFLLEHGARLDLFAAAMFGYFDIVSAVSRDFPEMHDATRAARNPACRARARRRRRRASGARAARGDRGDARERRRDGSRHGGLGRRRASLRLGAEGHPAGPAGRARRRGGTGDVGDRTARAADDPPQRHRRRGREEPRLPGHGIAVYYCRVGEHFPLHPARIYAALKEGTERATVEHPLRSTRSTRSPAKTRGRMWASGCRSSIGTSSPTGTVST